ncbi:MAG: B12-binding domain-containing radical SAM protein [Syntrophaceae bacterium]|nr:B12-binding domain-containing radical SAM protein [Syntrophaceae bacterium]
MFHVKHSPHILLINPWITDFAAYNLWARPLGLLSLAGLLRANGFRITLIDCLDFHVVRKKYGDGKFYKTKIEKPDPLKLIPRNYSQYGIPEEMVLKRLSSVEEKPDLIGITSGMTYWYPGVFKAIEITKKLFHDVPIVLGGIYANLCFDHAKRHSGADIVFKSGDEREVLKLISELTGYQLRTPCLSGRQANSDLRTETYPAFDLYPHLDYVCLSTSRGCPYRCTYCATPVLTKGFVRRDPVKVAEEIGYWTTHYPVTDIAFYDDALLVEASKHIIPILTEVIQRGIQCNFHTPNALHIREMDEEVAGLLFRAGFKTIRLGFETSNETIQSETGGKVDNQELRRAVKYLKRAGYSGEEIGVYVMAGLPGQKAEEVEESIAFVREVGARPILVEYSPIPHTPLFEKAKEISAFDLENEPLFHNNSILPCQWEGFTIDDYRRLKEELRRRE